MMPVPRVKKAPRNCLATARPDERPGLRPCPGPRGARPSRRRAWRSARSRRRDRAARRSHRRRRRRRARPERCRRRRTCDDDARFRAEVFRGGGAAAAPRRRRRDILPCRDTARPEIGFLPERRRFRRRPVLLDAREVRGSHDARVAAAHVEDRRHAVRPDDARQRVSEAFIHVAARARQRRVAGRPPDALGVDVVEELASPLATGLRVPAPFPLGLRRDLHERGAVLQRPPGPRARLRVDVDPVVRAELGGDDVVRRRVRAVEGPEDLPDAFAVFLPAEREDRVRSSLQVLSEAVALAGADECRSVARRLSHVLRAAAPATQHATTAARMLSLSDVGAPRVFATDREQDASRGARDDSRLRALGRVARGKGGSLWKEKRLHESGSGSAFRVLSAL